MSSELILCALRRFGRPATAAALVDHAVGLALDASYPRAAAAITAKTAAAHLKSLEGRALVKRQGTEKVNSIERPLWVPTDGFDSSAHVPPYAGTERDPAAVELMNRQQQLAVFAVQDHMVHELTMQRRELRDFFDQQDRRMVSLIERTRAQLAAHGLEPA